MYKTTFVPLVLYGCETCFLTQKEEYRLRLLENRMLRRICGNKRKEDSECWKSFHNEKHYNFCSA
jgi:hypothetical protein